MTMAAMGALLVIKSASLVRTAMASTPAVQSEATAPNPAASPTTPRVAGKPAEPATNAVPQTAGNARPSGPPPPPPEVSDSEREILLDLRNRRAQLDAREATLVSREAVLSAAEKRLAARVDQLTALQARLEDLEKARKERELANWNGLVKLYETMKPRDAAMIFNDLDKQVLLQVLDRMKESKAAPVLAAMQPDRARQITAALAQLREGANAPPGPIAAKTGG